MIQKIEKIILKNPLLNIATSNVYKKLGIPI